MWEIMAACSCNASIQPAQNYAGQGLVPLLLRGLGTRLHHAAQKCENVFFFTSAGFKHQVRVHLADWLRSPVLGDYKFGGPVFRLSPPLNTKMRSMKFVPGKVYLHASELEIPDYHQKGKTLVIRAPLPEHFCKTAKLLRLQLPPKYL